MAICKLYIFENLKIQKIYGEFERINIRSKYGIEEEGIKTDGKLSQATKSLIEKRNQGIKGNSENKQYSKTNKQKVELCELQKLVRKEIREDLRN